MFLDPFPYHINVDQETGAVHMALLETVDNDWDPSHCMEEVFKSIINLFSTPELSLPASAVILKEYTESQNVYEAKARQSGCRT